MTEQKHTPTPWIVSTDKGESFATVIRSSEGNRRRVAVTWCQHPAKDYENNLLQAKTNESNAAFIVKAVNNHEKLMEKLKEVSKAAIELNDFVTERINAAECEAQDDEAILYKTKGWKDLSESTGNGLLASYQEQFLQAQALLNELESIT